MLELFGTFLGSFRFVLGSFAEENPSHRRSIAGLQPTDRLNKRITSADPRQRRSIVPNLPIDREERRSFAPASRTFARKLAKLGRDGAGRSRPAADRSRVQPIDRLDAADRSRVHETISLRFYFTRFLYYFWYFSNCLGYF